MLAAGVEALKGLVPTAATEVCAAAIVSLLRRYTTGLSLAVAADELVREKPAEVSAVYRGRVSTVSCEPLQVWHMEGIPCAVMYVHSSFADVPVIGTVVRLSASSAGSLSQSPASVVSVARKNLGEAKVVLHLPTRGLVIERAIDVQAITLQEVWTNKVLEPKAVRAQVSEICEDGKWIRLVDIVNEGGFVANEQKDTQPSVLWHLKDCREIATLLTVGEVIAVTDPCVFPIGHSFEMSYGPKSVVYCPPAVNAEDGTSRPRKRARTATAQKTSDIFFGFEDGTVPTNTKGGKNGIGRGFVTIAKVEEDFRDGVVAICKHGYRLAFASLENVARELLPGTVLWLDGVSWDMKCGSWIVHSFLNLSEMTALLHSPFIRFVVPVRSFPDIAKNRGYCTVQACVRVVRISRTDDCWANLEVCDEPCKGSLKPNPDGDCNVKVSASERVVRSLWDQGLSSLQGKFQRSNQSGVVDDAFRRALLVSVILTEDVGKGFRYVVSAGAPAPVDW